MENLIPPFYIWVRPSPRAFFFSWLPHVDHLLDPQNGKTLLAVGGKNKKGQLGLGHLEAIEGFIINPFFLSQQIIDIRYTSRHQPLEDLIFFFSVGQSHTMVLTSGGTVWSFGCVPSTWFPTSHYRHGKPWPAPPLSLFVLLTQKYYLFCSWVDQSHFFVVAISAHLTFLNSFAL